MEGQSMAELSPEEKVKRARAGDATVAACMAKAVAQKYGAEGLAALKDELFNTYMKFLPKMAAQLGIRPGEGDCQDWVRLESALSDVAGAVYTVVESSPKRAVMRFTSCVTAGAYQRTFPQMCREVIAGVERAGAAAVNPQIRFTATKFLPEGDEYCEIICELED